MVIFEGLAFGSVLCRTMSKVSFNFIGMRNFFVAAASVVLLTFVSCSKEPSGNDEPPKKELDSTLVYSVTMPKHVFGFIGQNRYSYCPSVVDNGDGSTHVFFCGTQSNIFVDNIYHIQELADGSRTAERSVLQPSLEWDSRHDCDPSIVEGEFRMGGVDYRYAMFFLSNPMEYYYNEIGVAFSNDLAADSWVKYPYQVVKKPWQEEGDQFWSATNKSWGVGQPSAVSLDKKGKVLLTYTKGDVKGTCLMWCELDMSDMDNLSVGTSRNIVSNGWYMKDGETPDHGANSDFAVNLEEDRIVMVRPVHPFDNEYPAFIASMVEVLWMPFSRFLQGEGKWTVMYRIGSKDSGFPRNHNAGLKRDSFGHIKDWETPTVYFTVSKTAPEVEPSYGKHAEWTYNIYKTDLKQEYFYYEKKK